MNPVFRQLSAFTGGGNINDSSSGIGTSGVQGNSNYTFTSNYNFSGSAGGSGNYNLHEEGNFGNGTYALGCMSYAVSGAANNSEGYGGNDSETGTSPGVNYSGSDNYSGSANGNSNYTLTEQGQYASGVWTISQFTESETTVTSDNYSGAGQFSGSGPGGAYQGNYTYTDSGSSNFNLYGQGNYANGSFSFQTFSANLVAGVSTSYSEAGSNAAYVSYSRSDSASHNISLAETGHNQTGIYTLTVTDSSSHSFYAQPRFGQPISYSSSGSVSTTTYGTFNLAGGNPYLPYAGNVGQAGGQGVGILTPWYSRTTGAGEGGHGMAAGGNRVTYSLPKIQGERVEPAWSNGAASDGYSTDAGFGAMNGDVGLPPASLDDANLGLPMGPNGAGDSTIMPLSFSPQFQQAGKVPALDPPQPTPNNGPYRLSTQKNAWDCMCSGVQSFGHFPFVGPGGGGVLLAQGRSPGDPEGWIMQNRNGVTGEGRLVRASPGGVLADGSVWSALDPNITVAQSGAMFGAAMLDLATYVLEALANQFVVGPLAGKFAGWASRKGFRLILQRRGAQQFVVGIATKGAKQLTAKEIELLAKEFYAELPKQTHHIATNKGKWRKTFLKLFESVGLGLDECAANQMPLPFHNGRHTEKYHKYVLKRLEQAIEGLEGEEAKRALGTGA